MRLKLNLTLADGSSQSIAVTAESTAAVGDIATSLQAGLTRVPVSPEQALSLQILTDDGESLGALPPKSLLSESALRSGQRVRVVPWQEGGSSTGSSAPARLRIISGPNAGETHSLRLGPNIVGRDDDCDVVLADHLVSRRHARFTVTDRVEVWDMNSSNGVIMDEALIDHAVVGAHDTVTVGDTVIVVEQSSDQIEKNDSFTDLEFNRSPLVRPRYGGREFSAPKPPARPKASKFPLVAMAAPLLMGLVMFAVLRNPMSVIFVALSPLIAVGTYLDRKITDSKSVKEDRVRFNEDVTKLQDQLSEALDEEREARCGEVLSLAATVEAAFGLNSDLWYLRPEDEAFLSLNLGFGRAKSRHTFITPDRGEAGAETWELLDSLRQQCAHVNDVPIVANLHTCLNLGVAGSREWVDPIARNLVAQLTCLHSPAELTIAAVTSGESSAAWDWLMWLPHIGSTHSPLSGSHLAASAAAVANLVGGLEELIAARSEATGEQVIPAVVVIVENDAPVERGRLVSIAENGPAVGIHLLWLAKKRESLPAACHSYLIKDPDGHVTAGFVKEQRTSIISRVEGLSEHLAEELGRRMSPVLDASAPVLDQSDVPRSVSYVSLAGADIATDPSVTIERWRENGSIADGTGGRSKTPATLRALVGQGTQGEFALDLRAQGPHALVGGTTGAGKSEFLQSWILGMATGHSPGRVTFLFVDYKGGSAFADCVRLPHSVGLVTDLSPHLVRRALTSLRAELRYREHLLNRKKAKDLLALERAGDPDCPPALIIVVDEFAALVNEVPEFVDGVVDVAQRGRSLGLHLILATQRPAGVITSNLRANTNLRVALRMADETDSADVIDTPLASEFDPRVPGRGAVRTGPGRIALFQTGYAGGRTSNQVETSRIEVETMTFGEGLPWEIPQAETGEEISEEGPTDIARIVDAVVQAAAKCRIPAPRKPWLPELKVAYNLEELDRSRLSGDRIADRLPLGMADDPANQAQHPIYYDPDTDGNIAVFGASGSGKSTFLRSVAVAAAARAEESRTEVYGIDFSTAGLAMLEPLPVVGAVIDGSDQERVARLLGRLLTTLEERSSRYAAARAGSILEYRAATGHVDEPRILLLVDGLGAFREKYESALALSKVFGVFARLMSEGRAVGIHVALSAERPGALPNSLGASVQRRLVLRQADENGYASLNVPKDVLGPDSPPGRSVFAMETNEIQIATPGAASTPAEQGMAIDALAARLVDRGVAPTAGVERLAEMVAMSDLPTHVGGLPILGIGESTLAPLEFVPQGGFSIAGMPGSGRTTALRTIAQSLRRWDPGLPMYYFGPRRSIVGSERVWTAVARDHDSMKELAAEIKELAAHPADDRPGFAMVIESIGEWVGSSCDVAMAEVVKLARRNGHLVIGEQDTLAWNASWPLVAEIRADRRGLIMQPDSGDGDLLFRVTLPKVNRADYPLGRGVYVASGKTHIVQLAYPEELPGSSEGES